MLMRFAFLILFSGLAVTAGAQEEQEFEVEREPAAITLPTKRSYPGGADEEDLRVQSQLPDALVKTDTRGIQREVYRTMFNQDLKDERQDAVEE